MDDRLHDLCVEDVNGLCSSWILKQRLNNNSNCGFLPGTTFPPLAQHLPYLKDRLAVSSLGTPRSCRFLSEPELSTPKTEEERNTNCSLHNNEEDCEDCLFEFDIGSPVSNSEDDDNDLGAFYQNRIVNVVSEYEDSVAESVLGLRRSSSVCSDISSESICSQGKEGEPANGHGFNDIFGSSSSGFGSDRRGVEEIQNLNEVSLKPPHWRLLLETGNSTPILAASPVEDTPVVSLLNESILEDETLCVKCLRRNSDTDVISEDELEQIVPQLEECSIVFNTDQSGGVHLETDESDNLETDKSDHLETEKSDNETVTNIKSAASEMNSYNPEDTIDMIEKAPDIVIEVEDVDKLNNLEDLPSVKTIDELVPDLPKNDKSEKIEVASNLKVCPEKLQTLLGQLEQDKHYPSSSSDSSRENSPSRPSRFSVASGSPASRRKDGRPKLRKCTSLKTNKTPPTTPGTRKIVRFADIFGLEISEVKLFKDGIPKVPKAAYEDLNIDPSEYQVGSPLPTRKPIANFSMPPPPTVVTPTTTLVPMFTQPGGTPSFINRTHSQKVCLENAYMDGQGKISGIVRVLNISFHKAVTVRWSSNDWSTVTEQQAQYVPGSSQGPTDKFSFKVECGSLPVGSRVQLCFKYSCMGDHWDSNDGSNYIFQVFLNSSNGTRGGSQCGQTQPLGINSENYLPRNRGRGFAASHHQWGASPSQHGDDPWLRFM